MSKETVKSNTEHMSARQRAQHVTDEERTELDRRQRTDPAFLEHTKPEDPSPRPGQLTRDNVNPNIPSGPKDPVLLPDGRVDPNAGGIVDPKSLGMESQAGTPPPAASGAEQQDLAVTKEGEIEGSKYSINEPPGSDVYAHVPEPGQPLPEGQRGLGPSPKVARGPEASDDPDEIEDELDQMKEEGEVETRGKSPKKR
jgi:hypothetical protein